MSRKVPNVVFCRGGYMKYYRGITNDDITCVGGGEYNKQNLGHECCNFYKYENGKCYGYVSPPNPQKKPADQLKIDIDKIASSSLPVHSSNCTYIDNVTVIFTANGMVVGFYKNARAYRNLQKLTKPTLIGIDDYYFECDSENAILIAEKDRPQFTIKQGKSNWYGESNIFYAANEDIYIEVVDIVNRVLSYKQDYLDDDAKEDFIYQEEVNEASVKPVKSLTYKKEPRNEPVFVRGREVYQRDVKKAKEVLVANHCKCEIDGTHEMFHKKNSDELYAEAHHIVPMSKQKNYANNLDVTANIACLCSNCHRKIHYGKDAPKLIEKLYNSHKATLKASGINISLDELIDIYK